MIVYQYLEQIPRLRRISSTGYDLVHREAESFQHLGSMLMRCCNYIMDIEKLCDVRPCVLERNRPGFRAMMNRVGAPNHFFFEILLHIVYRICTPKMVR